MFHRHLQPQSGFCSPSPGATSTLPQGVGAPERTLFPELAQAEHLEESQAAAPSKAESLSFSAPAGTQGHTAISSACLHCAQESGHHPLQDLGCLLQRGRERSKDTFKNALGGKQRRKKMMLEFQVSYWIFPLLLLLRLLLGEGSPSLFDVFVDPTSFSQRL